MYVFIELHWILRLYSLVFDRFDKFNSRTFFFFVWMKSHFFVFTEPICCFVGEKQSKNTKHVRNYWANNRMMNIKRYAKRIHVNSAYFPTHFLPDFSHYSSFLLMFLIQTRVWVFFAIFLLKLTQCCWEFSPEYFVQDTNNRFNCGFQVYYGIHIQKKATE